MTPFDVVFLTLHTVSAAITCWYALCALNASTRKTRGWIRLALALLAIGAFAAMLNPPTPAIEAMGHLLVFVGLAGSFVVERRRHGCLNCPTLHERRHIRGGA